MSTLEDRLRRDLPPLADAMIDARDSSGSEGAAAVEPDGRSSVGGVGRFRPRKTGRALLGAAAAAVLVAVGVVVLQDDDPVATVDTAEVPAPDGFGTWAAIPDAPIAPRAYPVGAWTGSEALFWAGSTLDRGFAHSDAAVYDPGREMWRTIPEPGWGHPGLVGAVFDGSLYAVAKGGGARFDFDTEEWVDLPEVDGMFFSGIVASEDAIWALGPTATNPEGQPDLAIVRYDPDNDEWAHGPVFEGSDETAAALASLQSLDQPPVWTGTDLVVWGDQNGIAFDSAQAEWTVLPRLHAPEGDVIATRAVADGDGLSVVAHIRDSDGLHLGIAHLDATTSQWTWKTQDIPWIDLSTATVVPTGPWIVLLPADGPPITVHTRSGTWQRHGDAPITGVRGPGTVWTGTQLIVWGGQQGGPSGDDPATGMIWSPPSNDSSRAAPEPTMHSPPSGEERGVMRLTEGAWSGARSSTEGTELVISFTGSRPFNQADPCSVEYRAEASETADQVAVTVYGSGPAVGPTVCTYEGHHRTVKVSLQQPIGIRSLLIEPEGFVAPVFDGSILAMPGWLPDGWTLQRESGGHLAGPPPAATWLRIWGPPPLEPEGDQCAGADPTPIALTQGPLALSESVATDATGEQSVHTVHGNEATYALDDTNTTASLHWVEDDQSFVVTTFLACSTDTLTSQDTLLRFARALRVPN